MLLLSSISNKDVLFIFSANKVAAEEVPPWVPLEPEEADRSKQGNLSFSHIITCLPTNSVMIVL